MTFWSTGDWLVAFPTGSWQLQLACGTKTEIQSEPCQWFVPCRISNQIWQNLGSCMLSWSCPNTDLPHLCFKSQCKLNFTCCFGFRFLWNIYPRQNQKTPLCSLHCDTSASGNALTLTGEFVLQLLHWAAASLPYYTNFESGHLLSPLLELTWHQTSTSQSQWQTQHTTATSNSWLNSPNFKLTSQSPTDYSMQQTCQWFQWQTRWLKNVHIVKLQLRFEPD